MNIWTAWLQGRDAAPRPVRMIFDRWEELNPDCTLHVLEQDDADRILNDLGISQPKISPQVTTNLMRSHMLAEEGGVWVDSTLLPTRPLAAWLFPDLSQAGFFAFHSLGDPNLVLQNWFLLAERGNPLIVAWRDAYTEYFRALRVFPTWKRAAWHFAPLDYLRFQAAWRRRDTLWFVDPAAGRRSIFYPYAAHNYNLAWLLKEDPALREMWNCVPRRCAALPQMLAQLHRDPETSTDEFLATVPELLRLAPVHKLNRQDPIWERVLELSIELDGIGAELGPKA